MCSLNLSQGRIAAGSLLFEGTHNHLSSTVHHIPEEKVENVETEVEDVSTGEMPSGMTYR